MLQGGKALIKKLGDASPSFARTRIGSIQNTAFGSYGKQYLYKGWYTKVTMLCIDAFCIYNNGRLNQLVFFQ